jgi:hypothetical protein
MIDHLSHSQWRAWSECPAAAHAQYVTRQYVPGTTEAMALGTLTEAAMTAPGDAIDLIQTMREGERGHLLTTKGVPTKDAERAVAWGRQAAEALDLTGYQTQAELRPTLGGVTWHCRLDVWNRTEGAVWDIKTCPSDPLADEWVPHLETRGNFIAARGYGRQLALYREAVRQETGDICEVGIVAIGKHKTRDGEAIPNLWCFVWQDSAQLDGCLDAMAATCLRPWTCGTGDTVPPIPEMYECAGDTLPRCESCDWCVASRVDRVRWYSDPTRRPRV